MTRLPHQDIGGPIQRNFDRLTSDRDALGGRLDILEGATFNGHLLHRSVAAVGSAQATNTLWTTGGAGSLASGGLSNIPPDGYFHWDPADYAAPPAGWARKWLMKGQLVHNSTVPGTITYQIGVRRLTVGGGVGGIAYSFVVGDTEARTVSFVNPTGGTSTPAVTLIDPPAAGNYGGYFTWNATSATNGFVTMSLRIYLVYVPA